MTSDLWNDRDEPSDDDGDVEQPRSVATRFGSGQPRNTGGRPRGSKNLSNVVHKIAKQRISVTEGGRTRRISRLEALLLVIRNKAMFGDEAWIVLYEHARALSQPLEHELSLGVLIVPERSANADEWEQAAQSWLRQIKDGDPGNLPQGERQRAGYLSQGGDACCAEPAACRHRL